MSVFFSIIVPVYNAEKYIHRCIDSVLRQTFSDFELIVVNDGSVDNSGAICDEYAAKDSRIRTLYQENGGVSKARNVGIKHSCGQYITFLDSDDYVDICFLQQAHDEIVKTGVDLFFAGHYQVRNTEVMNTRVIQGRIDTETDKLTENQIIDMLDNNYIASSCGKVFSRNSIGETRFETNMKFGEDLCFMFDLISKPLKICAVEKAYYCHCIEYKDGKNLTSLVDIQKCENVVTTYRTLLEFKKRLETSKQFYAFLENRWVEDFRIVQSMILNCRTTVLRKYKMLKILLKDKRMKTIIRQHEAVDLNRFASHPAVLVMRQAGGKVKRVLMATMRRNNDS